MIGELLFIVKHVSPAFGMGQAIQFWQGAEDMPQDFNIENCAVEVKCRLGTTAPSVHISSVEQFCTQLSKMYLYVVTLGKTDAEAENVLNLPNLISQIRHELETAAPSALERFNNLIYQTDYVDLDNTMNTVIFFLQNRCFLSNQVFHEYAQVIFFLELTD